ncbi:hypothetical protein H5410_037320 [Solanum commersonii]|uniref:Uncharacterized protein n=1 Tax=Solanum commersonii TaxID=4109 RepID=A0A9J5Y963_SOLCO|nr:hypothetical protein H5410_037320 [Solanum commersonii]
MYKHQKEAKPTPFMAVPVRFTWSVKKAIDEGLILIAAKNPQSARGKSFSAVDSTTIHDETFEFDITRKGVHDNDEGGGEENLSDKGITKNIEDCLDACSHRILNFTQMSVIRGMIIIGFGRDEMGELLLILKAQGLTNLFLQGNKRRKMVREETRPFYINASGSPILISSVVSRMPVFLKADVISQILGANAPLQRLRSQLETNEKEIAALQLSDSAAKDKLHLTYKVEQAGLIEENSHLKAELLKSKATLETEQSMNSTDIKGLFELLKTHPASF